MASSRSACAATMVMDTQGKVAVVDLEPFMKVQAGQELSADVKVSRLHV